MRDYTWCTARHGDQIYVGDEVTILSPVNGHEGAGTVTQLLPGGAGDVPCVMVKDSGGRRIVVNAVNVTVDWPAENRAEQHASWLAQRAAQT